MAKEQDHGGCGPYDSAFPPGVCLPVGVAGTIPRGWVGQLSLSVPQSRHGRKLTPSGSFSVDLNRPMGSWRKAWRIASEAAGVRYRPHDMRHTFISRLAENPSVSEQTIKALAGHVSRHARTLQPHPIRGKASCDSVPRTSGNRANFAGDRAQTWAQ